MIKKTIEMFTEQANNIHNNKYGYENSIYINSQTKVEIICKEHGSFFQIPNNHLGKRQGCPKCGKVDLWNTRGRLTYTKFIEKLPNKHKEKYTYPEQIVDSSETLVRIICPLHGEFQQKAVAHSQGLGCKACGGNTTKTADQFKKEADTVHNSFYDYSKFIYKTSKDKGIIICPVHGEFEQTPDAHINGKSGCLYCGSNGTYNKGYFDKHPLQKDKQAIIYFLQFEKEGEMFVKIGITLKDISKRFKPSSRNKGYKIITLLTLEKDLYNAWNLEQQILSTYSSFSYEPLTHFAGHTECFKMTAKDLIIKELNEAAILKNLM